MFVCQAVAITSKKLNWQNSSQTIVVLALPFFYFLPIIKALFVFKINGGFHSVKEIGYSPCEVLSWLFIEICYFFVFIFSMAMFCAFAYCEKYSSLWK